ncbi:unnamed protein product [Ectocarpus fasciculatus]
MQDHAMAMVKYAFRTLFELERIKTEEDLNFEMRVGLHTGPCIGGVIGRLKPRYLCWGRTPLISNELEAAGTPGKLLVSSATFAQLNKQVLLTRGLKFRPGEPLHVKTFDDLADEEVPTFYIEMDSITAFTILANEIAEDRAAARRGSTAHMFDDGELTGTGEDGSLKKTLLGVTRLKRLFHGKSSAADPGMFDSSGNHAAGGGRMNNPRRPNHLSATGVVMSTQSAYLASPPGSPESKQVQTFDNNSASLVSGWGNGGADGIGSGLKGWSTGKQAGGQRGGGGGGGAGGGGGGGATSAAGRGAPPSRLRRASSAGVDGRKEHQRRRSSLAVIPTSLKNSLQAGGGAAVAAAAAVASKATGGGSSAVAVSGEGDGRNGSFGSLTQSGDRAGATWGWDGESSESAGSERGRGGRGGTVKESSNRRRSSPRRSGGNGGDGSIERLDAGRRGVGGGDGDGWEDGGDELEGRAPAGAAAASDRRSSSSKRERRTRSSGGSGARKSWEEGDGDGGSGGSSSGEDGKAPSRRGKGGRRSLYIDDDEDSGRGGDGNKFLDDDDDATAGRRRRSRRTSGEGEETSFSSSRGTRTDPTAAARADVLFSDNESDSDPDLDGGGDSSRWNDD